MRIDKEELKDVIAGSISLGMATQQWIYSPPNDNISMNAAARYLAKLGYKNPKSVLYRLEHDNMLHIHKPDGSADNTKISISAMELQKALLNIKIIDIIY
ncbi:MAG: hypothetical protein ACI4T5_02650 [Prevotella sp.]